MYQVIILPIFFSLIPHNNLEVDDAIVASILQVGKKTINSITYEVCVGGWEMTYKLYI